MKKRHRQAQAGIQATIIATLISMMLEWAKHVFIKGTLGKTLT